MRRAILIEGREPLQQLISDAFISADLTEWCLPGRVGHDRQWTPPAGVIGAENYATRGNFQSRVHRARHRA